ncbi:MAG: sigma-54 dependent transcriptional regulator [Gammaproteobacteria bacterium]|jgi:DNA-binding NtrC family response regulator
MADVLLVDDDKTFTDATAELLGLLGHKVTIAESVESARSILQAQEFDRILLDLMLPDGSGFHLLDDIPQNTGTTQVTIITGHPSIKSRVSELVGDNVNYLVKPIRLEQLEALFGDRESTPSNPGVTRHFDALIGETDSMHELYRQIEQVARTQANVMLVGESGVGKEVFAQAIHNASAATGKLVACNCGAFPAELIGSELFGHEKGAFTGAAGRKAGVFEQAQDGTLFLDEITEMPLSQQPNLLRVLETSTVTRLGASDVLPVNCRVISATNRSPDQIAKDHSLREDIYFRLAVFPMTIPPLRDRQDDIPLLVDDYLSSLNKEQNSNIELTDEGLQRLLDYDWPGNVRELRHLIHRSFILSDPESSVLELPKQFSSPFSNRDSADASDTLVGKTIEEVERKLIMDTLECFENNKTRAAEALGVSIKTLYNRLNSYESDEREAKGGQ